MSVAKQKDVKNIPVSSHFPFDLHSCCCFHYGLINSVAVNESERSTEIRTRSYSSACRVYSFELVEAQSSWCLVPLVHLASVVVEIESVIYYLLC